MKIFGLSGLSGRPLVAGVAAPCGFTAKGGPRMKADRAEKSKQMKYEGRLNTDASRFMGAQWHTWVGSEKGLRKLWIC